MSVKRYTAAGSGVMRTDPKGGYVNYSDYLELQNQPDALTAYLYAAELAKDDIKTLKAEIERLRKAGDAVALDYAERIEIEAGNPAKTLMKTVPVLRDWNAAKEGKPSV